MIYIIDRLKNLLDIRGKYVILLVIIFSMTALTSIGLAQDLHSVLPINPVPNYDPGEGVSVYIQTGVLDRIGENEVVINDSLIRFSSGQQVAFRSETDMSELTLMDFKVGNRVGYQLDKDGRLIGLWLLK